MPSWIDFFMTCQDMIRCFGTGWKESEAGLGPKSKEDALIQLIQSAVLGFGYMHSNQ